MKMFYYKNSLGINLQLNDLFRFTHFVCQVLPSHYTLQAPFFVMLMFSLLASLGINHPILCHALVASHLPLHLLAGCYASWELLLKMYY